MAQRFDKLMVMAFWHHAHGLTWSEWMELSNEERGVFVDASMCMPSFEVEEPDVDVQPSGPDPVEEEPPKKPEPRVVEKIPGITA